MLQLRHSILFVFVMACGGAQSGDVRTANPHDGRADPAAHASQPAQDTRAPEPTAETRSARAQPRDEVADLEGQSFSPEEAESRETPRSNGVARGRSGGTLVNRRSSMPTGHRRARRAPAPETLDLEAIEAIIDEHVREVHYCYTREFAHRPDVSGRIVIAATIAPDGHVSEAHITSSTIRSARVDQCVVQTFSRWEFPRAQASTTVEHPFTLSHH